MLRVILGMLIVTYGPVMASKLEDINWKDENLKQCVMDTAHERNWEKVGQVTELKCHNADIINIDSLTVFTSLEKLSLFNNRIESADLSALTALTELNLANNQLVELHIAGLHKLETLFLFRNDLTTVDLSGLTALKKVRLMQNKLNQLDIRPLTSLETGYFFDNELEDLQIEGLNQLTFLDVRQNPMPDELYDFYDEQEGIIISHDGNADDWK